MSVCRNAFQKLHRAYPSLNLMIQVSKDLNAVQVVLPGLRFDDINHTGQPNMVTMFDMMSHVETASFGHEPSFLDYLALRQQNLRVFVKACVMDISSEFYETTTPKAPLDVQVKLTDIGNSTFTTTNELFCGGDLNPSIRTRSVYAFTNKKTSQLEPVPDWWRNRFTPLLKSPSGNNKPFVTTSPKSAPTHMNCFTIPLSDTDHNERTRCASYLRYFTENTSVASRKELLKHIKSSFHEFHIKRLSMLYFGATNWGDMLISETWQGEKPLKIMCEISKDENPVWFAEMELYDKVFGLPGLETTHNSTS
ncbi:uncharacterized protein LOC123549431 [Mercenaria mercenaria]|uniref:uncharacterized protein LOC123549431 n=1 Tax=Mercenaria mercenaria TaxID=6596 RepID=UPI001E1E1928|nr:uncharacterized protein LOC123549431 [Mercenaria mercenaria]